MTVNEKEFVCRICGKSFRKRARHCYYCDTCRKKKKSRDFMLRKKRLHPETVVGCGSGGNQWGEKNHQYKDGLSHYQDVFRKAKPDIKSCEICGSQKYLVVHHVDQDRKNNAPDNLMMLCRRCHAQVHGLAASLGETPMLYREEL